MIWHNDILQFSNLKMCFVAIAVPKLMKNYTVLHLKKSIKLETSNLWEIS